MIREAEDLPLDLKNIAGSFLVFLHDNEIAPGEVTTTVLQAYYEHLLANGGKAKEVCMKHVNLHLAPDGFEVALFEGWAVLRKRAPGPLSLVLPAL